MATKKQVVPAKRASTAVALPDDLNAQLMADAGSGFEEATRDSYAIPFLMILQDLSPQTKKSKAEYIEGAKPGRMLQTVTQKIYDELRIIPCYFTQVFVEWVPRVKGGGFVAAHAANTPLAKQGTREGSIVKLPNGNDLIDTRQHFVLIEHDDGSTEGVLMPMKSTQLKVSRRWMAQMRAAVIEVGGRIVEPPMFAWSYKLTTVEESNDQGTWYSWVISDRERVATVEVYNKARAFNAMMKQGGLTVNYDEMERQTGSDVPADLDNDIDA